ncbi:hypothetical protein C8J57DRAFT_1533142 [Mycena rebaudengoi]|nr:hypothetical protein C8J57DRAFT_1533142 [Mycena rebaudengoi]
MLPHGPTLNWKLQSSHHVYGDIGEAPTTDTHIATALVAIAVVAARAIVQGRSTTREWDLPRGAHIIVLTPSTVDASARPPFIQAFWRRFLEGQEACALFMDEYRHEREREPGALATFLLTTLLLQVTAPVERDIRIVNCFYAAAAAAASPALFSSFSPLIQSPPHLALPPRRPTRPPHHRPHAPPPRPFCPLLLLRLPP